LYRLCVTDDIGVLNQLKNPSNMSDRKENNFSWLSCLVQLVSLFGHAATPAKPKDKMAQESLMCLIYKNIFSLRISSPAWTDCLNQKLESFFAATRRFDLLDKKKYKFILSNLTLALFTPLK